MNWRTPWLRHRLPLVGFAVWDVGVLYLSYNMTYLTRIGKWDGWSPGLAVMAMTWLGASYLTGRYSPQAQTDTTSHFTRLGKTLLASCAVLGVFIVHSWVYQVVDAQTRFRGFLIPVAVSTCILSTLGQAVQYELKDKKRKWLVLGNEVETKTVSQEIAIEKSDMLERVNVKKTEQACYEGLSTANGTTSIAVGRIEGCDQKYTERLLRHRERGGHVIPLLSWCEQELQRIPPELVDSEWLIQAEGFGLRPGSTSWRIKRLGDIGAAGGLIAVTFPLILLGAALIWLEDRGPIFYKQVRSGLYGHPIRIWKLRSMRVDAEKSGAQWARKADPRVTNVGKIIRTTRIDELPQLFSVLSGDLSLIGPRPERPEIEEELEMKIPNYRVRHWIRPGLSGWAQVCYPYGASVEDSRMKLSYDIFYLRNASLLLDILITIKTIRLVARGQGASPKEIQRRYRA